MRLKMVKDSKRTDLLQWQNKIWFSIYCAFFLLLIARMSNVWSRSCGLIKLYGCLAPPPPPPPVDVGVWRWRWWEESERRPSWGSGGGRRKEEQVHGLYKWSSAGRLVGVCQTAHTHSLSLVFSLHSAVVRGPGGVPWVRLLPGARRDCSPLACPCSRALCGLMRWSSHVQCLGLVWFFFF